MEQLSSKQLEIRAGILKAMAHPSRLLVLQALNNSEMSVAQLTELVGADMSTVSRHLAVLKGAGLLKTDKRGNQVFYQLTAPCVLSFFQCLDEVLASQFQDQIDMSATS